MQVMGGVSIVTWTVIAVSYALQSRWLEFGGCCIFLMICLHGLGSFSASSSTSVTETSSYIIEETHVSLSINFQYTLVVLVTVSVVVYRFVDIIILGGG